VAIDGATQSLAFSPSDDLVASATAFARKHDMHSVEACPPQALAAMGMGDCAVARLVSAMHALLPPPPCVCQMQILMPLPDQIWLLRSVAVNVAVQATGCGVEHDGTGAFEGQLKVRASLGGAQVLQSAFEMRALEGGELSVQLPETLVAFDEFHVALAGQTWPHHPCAGQALAANVTCNLRPFTTTDPRDTLSVEDLERRLRLASETQQPAAAASFAYASLLYSDDYLPGLLVLAASLRAVGAKHPLITLVPINDHKAFDADSGAASSGGAGLAVSGATAAALASQGVEIVPVAWLNLGAGFALPGLGSGIWLKLHLWTLTQFQRIVYLDADTFVLRNVDELFALRQKEPPRAFPSGALRSERCGAQTPGGSTETYSLLGGVGQL
jgi:hypothetical protein